MYGDRKPPEEPPCVTCRTDPMDENRDALRVFFIVRNQFIMGMDGPIELNHLAIDAAIEREGINGKACFGKICILGNWWINRIREKSQ